MDDAKKAYGLKFRITENHLTTITYDDILNNDITPSVISIYHIEAQMDNAANRLPLTESTYLILLSLLTERHGYGIMQYVEGVSRGRVKLGPGTLYGGLKSMVKKKMIEELEGDNSRRRCYRLTSEGRRLLDAEIERLEELTDLGKQAAKNPTQGGV